jgi:hypothetical protein
MSVYVLVLQLRIIALRDAQGAANTSSTSDDTIKPLLGEFEALQVRNKTSEDTSRRLRGTIDALLIRLKGIQFPLSGPRVVGTRIVEVTNTLFAPSFPFAAPASWTAPQQYQTFSSALPFAPDEGFAMFSAPAPQLQEIPKALAPSSHSLSAPSSTPPVGFAVASAPSPAPQ